MNADRSIEALRAIVCIIYLKKLLCSQKAGDEDAFFYLSDCYEEINWGKEMNMFVSDWKQRREKMLKGCFESLKSA